MNFSGEIQGKLGTKTRSDQVKDLQCTMSRLPILGPILNTPHAEKRPPHAETALLRMRKRVSAPRLRMRRVLSAPTLRMRKRVSAPPLRMRRETVRKRSEKSALLGHLRTRRDLVRKRYKKSALLGFRMYVHVFERKYQ